MNQKFVQSKCTVACLLLILPASTACFSATNYGGLAIGIPREWVVINPSVVSTGAVQVLYGFSAGISTQENQFWHQHSPGIEGDSIVGGYFGSALTTGDFNRDGIEDLAVGIPGEKVGNFSDAGAVNVLYGFDGKFTAMNSQLWTQASNGITGSAEVADAFGSALASGDFNGDKYMDLAIGVPDENVGTVVDAGAVNIIFGSPKGLTSAKNQMLLHSSSVDGIEEEDYFGYAVAAGNYNGDGYCDLVVGIPGEEPGYPGLAGFGAGAITVWYGSAAGLVPPVGGLAVIHRGWAGIPGVGDDEAFGFALASGNFNNDAYADIAVGAPKSNYSTSSRAGEINILYGGSDGLPASSPSPQMWRQDLIRGTDTPESADEFGSALAAGDINDDGTDDLAIGVPGETFSGVLNYREGAVHVMYGSASGLSDVDNDFVYQNLPTIPGSSEAYDSFGQALAIGDINGDGYSELAIGIPGENSDAGMVNLLYGSSSGITTSGNMLLGQHWPSIPDTAEASDSFGRALVIFPHGKLNQSFCVPLRAKNGSTALICL